MSDNIVTLSLVKPGDPKTLEPVQEVVDHFRGLLERAETGEIRATASIVVGRGDDLSLGTAWGGDAVLNRLVSGAALMQHYITTMALNRDIP